jgi:dienelactone hydrolase
LAEEGYVLLIVHFFDRTGHDGVDPKRIREKDFLEWMGALRDGIQYARGLPNVDKDRVGLLGFSLGAYLSVAVAADEKIPVKAVASYFGGAPDKLWPQLTKLPPLLIVHGGLDNIVPVAAALRLAGFCKQKGLPCECKIYEKEGHLFEQTLTKYLLLKKGLSLFGGKNFEVAEAIAEAVQQETTVKGAVQTGVNFFKQYLK